MMTFHSAILDFFASALEQHLGFFPTYVASRKANLPDVSLSYVLKATKAINDFLTDQSVTLKKLKYKPLSKDVRTALRNVEGTDIPRLCSRVNHVCQELRQGRQLVHERFQTRLFEYVRALTFLIVYSIEIAFFGSRANELADQMEVLANTVYSFAAHANSLLGFRCEFKITKRILKRLVAQISQAYQEFHSRLMPLLSTTPAAFQMCMHTRLSPVFQKISKEDKLLPDLIDIVRRNVNFVAVTPMEIPPDTELSQLVRMAFLIAHSILVNHYSLTSLAGTVELLHQNRVRALRRLEMRQTPTGQQVQAVVRLGLDMFTEALGQQDESAIAIAAIKMALNAAVADSEPLAIDFLIRLFDMMLADRARVGPVMVRRCAQLCLFHTATLAVKLFGDIVRRLKYSVERPPDSAKIEKLSTVAWEYLEELSQLIPIDSAQLPSAHVRGAMMVMREFLTTEVRLDSEFYEAKFRKAITAFSGYCATLRRIFDEAAPAFSSCEPRLLEREIEAFEAKVSDRDASPWILSKSLFDIEAVAAGIEAVPAAPIRSLCEAAYALAPLDLDLEAAQGTLDSVAQQITALKTALPGMRAGGFVGVEANAGNVPGPRKALYEKLALLSAAMSPVETAGIAEDRNSSVVVQVASSRSRQFVANATPPVLPRVGRKSTDYP
jgi:hypothetical protein